MALHSYHLDSKERALDFQGKILGSGTSRALQHNHPGYDYITQAPPASAHSSPYKPKCSACRWNEVTVYKAEDGSYVAYTEGQTIVPGENVYSRIFQVRGGVALVDALTVRTPGGPFLPRPAAAALAQAAESEDSIYDAFNDRAVI